MATILSGNSQNWKLGATGVALYSAEASGPISGLLEQFAGKEQLGTWTSVDHVQQEILIGRTPRFPTLTYAETAADGIGTAQAPSDSDAA